MTLRRIPSVDEMATFDVLARLKSHERAAEELNLTRSAVSKRISAIEARLGVALFSRSAKSPVLTPLGVEYLEQVRAALAVLCAIPLHRSRNNQADLLRISAPPTFARQILVPNLESFTTAYPEVELEVTLSIAHLDVAPTGANVEIRNGNARASGGLQVMHDVVLPVASEQLLKRANISKPEDILLAPLIRSPLEHWSTWFRVVGVESPEPTHGIRLVDLGLTLEAAAAGQGVALARPSLARPWLESSAFRPVFHQTAVPLNQYYVLPYARSRTTESFVEWLIQTCARAVAKGEAAAGLV